MPVGSPRIARLIQASVANTGYLLHLDGDFRGKPCPPKVARLEQAWRLLTSQPINLRSRRTPCSGAAVGDVRGAARGRRAGVILQARPLLERPGDRIEEAVERPHLTQSRLPQRLLDPA